MLIRVKCFFSLIDIIGQSYEIKLRMERATLRDILDRLVQEYGEAFYRVMFDPATGNIRPENPILVNGRHYRNLSNSLDTPLHEGDLVAIFPPVAGG